MEIAFERFNQIVLSDFVINFVSPNVTCRYQETKAS